MSPMPDHEKETSAMKDAVRGALCALHGLKWQIDYEITKFENLQKQLQNKEENEA